MTLIILSYPLCSKKIKIINYKSFDGSCCYVIFWGIILFLFLALRSTNIGIDTSMYEYIYNNSEYYFNLIKLSDIKSIFFSEIGFYYLTYFCSKFMSFRLYLALISFLSLAPIIYIIKKYSNIKYLSLILYIGFSYYTFAMSGLRQACAIGFIVLSYDFIKEKKLFLYLLTIIIAISFHSSSLIFFPAYWIAKIRLDKNIKIVSCVFILITYLLKNKIWEFASLFSRQNYSFVENAGGEKMYFFMLLTILLGLVFKKSNVKKQRNYKEKKDYNELFYFQIISTMICPIASFNPALARIYYFYHIFLILFIPDLLSNIIDKKMKIIIECLFVLISFYYFYTQIISADLKIVPYSFFWQ